MALTNSYACPAPRLTIYAGQPVPPPIDVLNNVWTPNKDASGNILGSSWKGLPLNEWCRVEGSGAVAQLTTQLLAGGYNPATADYGNSRLIATFLDYNGMALDQLHGRAITNGPGGHGGSSFNGTFSLMLESMGVGAGWKIDSMPSHPDAVGLEWSSAYRALNPGHQSFTSYTPTSDSPPDILPDGRMTSRHQYNTQIYDTLRNVTRSFRLREWTYAFDTGQHSQRVMSSGGPIAPTGVGGMMFYDAIKDRDVGFLPFSDVDYSKWVSINRTTGSMTTSGTPFAWVGSHAGDIVGRKIRILAYDPNASADKWMEYDLDSDVFTWGVIANGLTYDYNNELRACTWVPELGKLLVRFSYAPLAGQWRWFDWATKLYQPYIPAGLAPPFSAYPGRKVFYYATRKCVVYITTPDASSDSVYVMRTG